MSSHRSSSASRRASSRRASSDASTSQRSWSESSRSDGDGDAAPHYRNARDPPLRQGVSRVTVSADNLSNESEWETMKITASAAARGAATTAARRRRFCAAVRRMAGTKRGIYEIMRSPGAVSALRRLMSDEDVDCRRGACEAVSELAKTPFGAALLCSTDAQLKEAWGTVRTWEWKMALARIKRTFGYKTYAQCLAAFATSTSLPLKASGEAVDKYLSRQVFFPLQSNFSPTFRDETHALESLSKVLSRPDDKPEVLYAALSALDTLLSTVNFSAEVIPLVNQSTYATAQRLSKATEASLAALDPVEAFMGSDWTEAVRGPGCVGTVVMLFKRWVLTDESTVDGDEASEREEEDEDDREAIRRRNDKAVLSVTQFKLDRRLMVLASHKTDAIIREDASRILYEATLNCENKSVGKRVFEMLVSSDSVLRASTLSWMAYLFVQHVRTVRAFVSIDENEIWPVTKTVQYLLSDDVLRSASRGLSEQEESIRLGATRMLRAAWDAVSVKPSAMPEKSEENPAIFVDERLSFPGSHERWLVFVNSGAVAALCDMQLSRAIGASQLADSTLDHLVKTEPAAMQYLLSRNKQPSAAEKREVIRQKVEHHKADFPRSRVVETQTLPAEEESPPTPTDAQDSLESVNIAPHRARWREYRENHKPIVAKFVDVDSFGDDELDREGWRAKAEDFIIAGGSARKKKGYETHRGPYERAVLREGTLGLAAKSDKMPVVFSANPNVGPYAAYDAAAPRSASAKVFTRPSKRHEIPRDGIPSNART